MTATVIHTPNRAERRDPTMLDVLRNRNFRLLWLGEGISILGDQFYLIALPWLVLQLTGDSLAMGTVLATAGIPRALFMLVGGALTDRSSPRRLMLVSNLFRLTLVAVLAGLVLGGVIQLWMVYAFALLFGLADAFFYPAQNAIVPQLVDGEQLQAGNALIQGTAQLGLFLGPVLAGTLIALLDGRSTAGIQNMRGLGIAFGIDALSFVASAATLTLINAGQSHMKAGNAAAVKSVLVSIREGLSYVWHDVPLRIIFFVVAAINVLVSGPISVGIPVLADARLPEGAAAFGLVMSAYGGGALLGILLAGVLPKPAPQHMAVRLLRITTLLGVGLGILGLSSSTVVSALAGLMMGTVNGYINVLFITWLQGRTPQTMLGRMMSVLMFAGVGLNPVSTALAGALLDVNATALFLVTGSLLAGIVLLSTIHPAMQAVEPEISTRIA
jgi:MFS family permease